MEFPLKFEGVKRAYFASALEAMIFLERAEAIGKYIDCSCHPLRNRVGWVVIW